MNTTGIKEHVFLQSCMCVHKAHMSVKCYEHKVNMLTIRINLNIIDPYRHVNKSSESQGTLL